PTSFPTRRSSDLDAGELVPHDQRHGNPQMPAVHVRIGPAHAAVGYPEKRPIAGRRRLRELADLETSRGAEDGGSDHGRLVAGYALPLTCPPRRPFAVSR